MHIKNLRRLINMIKDPATRIATVYDCLVSDIVSKPGIGGGSVMRQLYDLSQAASGGEEEGEFIDALIAQITEMHFMQRHKKDKSMTEDAS